MSVRKMMKKGFTLVEMAIVLVIISLLLGGVFVGLDVIENSKVQSVITKMIAYNSSYKNFKDIYNAYPGDMIDAETVWGSGNVVNGDGDGLIEDDVDGDGTVERPTENEDAQAWRHMNYAGLLQGNYDGEIEAATLIQLGQDIPSGEIIGTGYYMGNETQSVTSATNSISFAKLGEVYDQGIAYAVFSPEQAYYIDSKLDDINPSQGQLVTIAAMDPSDTSDPFTYYSTSDCVDVGGAGNADNQYALQSYENRCYVIFYLETAE